MLIFLLCMFLRKKIKYDLFINFFILKFDDIKGDYLFLIEFIKMNIFLKYK